MIIAYDRDMKTLKLVYNPQSGDKTFAKSLDACTEIFQRAGYTVHLCRVDPGMEQLDAELEALTEDAIMVAGGDGTVNFVVNALKRYGHDVPLGIFPAGTANDFAMRLKMPKDPKEAAEALMAGRIMEVDLGLIRGLNDSEESYFINVCGAGLLTTVSQTVDTHFKDALGKLAYYLKGLGQIANVEPLSLRITTPEAVYEDAYYMLLLLNGGGAGGFDKLSPDAKIDDGLLDLVAFSVSSVMDVAAVFFKILTGAHLEDKRTLFIRSNHFIIESLDNLDVNTDTDGEVGLPLPLTITCEPKALRLFVSNDFEPPESWSEPC